VNLLQFLRDLSITRKLSTAFLILVVMALLTGWIAIERLAAINATTVEMRSNWLIGIQKLNEADNLITDERRLVNGHILSEEPRDKAKFDTQISAGRLQFDTVWGSYVPTATLSDEKLLATDFKQKYETYLREINAVLVHSRGNRPVEARGYLLTRAGPAQDAARAAMHELVAYNQRGANDTVAKAAELFDSGWKLIVGLILAFALVSAGLVWLMQNLLLKPILRLTRTLEALAGGKSDVRITELDRVDEIGRMAHGLVAFQTTVKVQQDAAWVNGQSTKIIASLQGVRSIDEFARQLMTALTPLVGAQVSVFYHFDSALKCFVHKGSFGYKHRKGLVQQFAPGVGIVGQCAMERSPIVLSQVPDDYIHVSSGLGSTVPRIVMATPVIASDGRILAVLELASLQRMDTRQLALIDELLPLVAVNIELRERSLRAVELEACLLQQQMVQPMPGGKD
jgi:two-component system sensor histidine kinase/response regulator